MGADSHLIDDAYNIIAQLLPDSIAKAKSDASLTGKARDGAHREIPGHKITDYLCCHRRARRDARLTAIKSARRLLTQIKASR